MTISYVPAHESALAPVDPARWPDVARPPHASALRTAVAERIIGRALARLPLRVRHGAGEPSPYRVPRQEGALPTLTLHDPGAFHRRIGADGLIGFGESYMAGEWDSDDLVDVLTVLATHVDDLVPAPLRRLREAWVRGRPEQQRNTPRGRGRTSTATTTCPTNCSPCSSTGA